MSIFQWIKDKAIILSLLGIGGGAFLLGNVSDTTIISTTLTEVQRKIQIADDDPYMAFFRHNITGDISAQPMTESAHDQMVSKGINPTLSGHTFFRAEGGRVKTVTNTLDDYEYYRIEPDVSSSLMCMSLSVCVSLSACVCVSVCLCVSLSVCVLFSVSVSGS